MLGWGLAAGSAAAQTADVSAARAPPLSPIAPLASDEPVGFYIADDRTNADAPGADTELCAWALDDWIRHSDGRLRAVPASESEALVRVYFVSPGAGRYGEMRPILVHGQRGAEVYIRTETDTLGAEIASAASEDPLFRDSVVYLTCLHEIGHAFGMVHTDRFEDVMYFFGFGGDIPAFFSRYRSRLSAREDIAVESGLSAGDIEQLLAAYPAE